MMPSRLTRAVRRRDDTGATIVEFALVAPFVVMVLFGIVAGCFLAYQNSALHDGATAGARMASIESSLVAPTNGQFCESNVPIPIEKAVSQAAPLLHVNPAPLCASSGSSSTLTQSSTVNGDVNIVVTCGGTCAAPTSTTVSLTLSAQGLVSPFGLTYNMSASSQVPVLTP